MSGWREASGWRAAGGRKERTLAFQEAELARPLDRLLAGGRLKLAIDRAQVRFDRALRKEETVGEAGDGQMRR